ncbi:hypothetical protein MKY20_24365 [Cytobacillus sp. FSL W8-0315]|uniref:hypothetical protein n=1 Tax=Cytobacillus sp. FSL W8-0315 TaxID=2921600 RepID=UPI000304E1B5
MSAKKICLYCVKWFPEEELTPYKNSEKETLWVQEPKSSLKGYIKIKVLQV